MAEVVSFVDYRPPARFDLLPWTEVRIQEATAEDGTFAQIDVVALAPLDADPSDPQLRSFTTQLGTALDYWYRVVFADADGDTSQPSTPVQNVAGGDAAPVVLAYATTDELFRILKITTPSAEQEIAGQRVLDSAALEIDAEIGLATPYTDPPALVVEVNLERAVEHWEQQEAPFGILGIGDTGAVYTSRDSWDRHALKLAPLKQEWGIA